MLLCHLLHPIYAACRERPVPTKIPLGCAFTGRFRHAPKALFVSSPGGMLVLEGASTCMEQLAPGPITDTSWCLGQRLKLYNRVPTNGLVLYCGTVLTEDGKEKQVRLAFPSISHRQQDPPMFSFVI